MTGKLKKFQTLVQSPAELYVFIKIGAWILIVTLLLRMVSIPKMMRLLDPRKTSRKSLPRTKLVNFCSFWLGRETAFLQRSCLKRSLVLFRYLNMQAEPARFFIGVRKEDGELKGHSWIMINGKPLFPEDDLNYKLIFCYPEEKSPEQS